MKRLVLAILALVVAASVGLYFLGPPRNSGTSYVDATATEVVADDDRLQQPPEVVPPCDVCEFVQQHGLGFIGTEGVKEFTGNVNPGSKNAGYSRGCLSGNKPSAHLPGVDAHRPGEGRPA